MERTDMTETLQQIRTYIPGIILHLYQRRLLDPNAEVTQDELIEAHWELAQELKFLEYKQTALSQGQEMLQRLIEHQSLYADNK